MNKMTALQTILSACHGVTVKKRLRDAPFGGSYYEYKFLKVGDIELPAEGIFIKINATATKGTIAKVVAIETDTYSERYPDLPDYATDQHIVAYGCTLIYEVEGRKQQGRIKDEYVSIVEGQPETKYVRSVKTHPKKKVKNPVNKFKQEMKRGDWVIGVKRGHSLGIGRITRWTNSNVWGVTGDDLNDKSKEFQFASISETFTMPDDKHEQLLTMAVLKGWEGS